MKLKLISFLLAAFFLFGFAQAASATKITADSSEMALVPPYRNPPTSFTSQQFYSVIFDGEGEAAVAAKFVIFNTGKQNLASFDVEIPGNVRLISAIQEVGNPWSPSYFPIEYRKEQLSKSSRYRFALERQVQSQESSVVILYYKAMGHAKQNFGVFDFDFETANMNFDSSARVAINVQEGLFLKGAESSVSYNSFSLLESVSKSGVQSSELQGISNRIEWDSGFVRNAEALDPLESLHVTGQYSASKILLFRERFMIGSSVFAALLFAVIFAAKRIRLKRNIFTPVVVGFVSALSTIAIWFGGIWLISNFSRMIGYGFSSMAALLLLVFAVLIVSALFGPSYYIGQKYGFKEGFVSFGATLISLTLISFTMFVLLASLSRPY